MADDGNGGAARATIATLDARVAGLDRDYQDLKRTLLDLDSKIDQSIASLANRFENSLSSLTSKIEQKQTPFIAIMGAMIAGIVAITAIVTGIGALAYNPIQRDTARLDANMATVLDRGVFQREYINDQSRTADTLRGLRTDVMTTIQQQRYNTDQAILTKNLEDVRLSVEALRLRTFDAHGRMSTHEQFEKDLDKRLDAISARLAQHIRDQTGRTP